MLNDKYTFRAIGTIHSQHTELSKIPIQPVFCSDIPGTVELNPEYVEGLKTLEGFSHIYLFYYFHRSDSVDLQLKPFLSDVEKGIFATRAPHRPNKLGMSVVRLEKIEGNILSILGVDILDGTPLLDIKPYIARFDARTEVKSGWQDTVSDDEANIRGNRDFTG